MYTRKRLFYLPLHTKDLLRNFKTKLPLAWARRKAREKYSICSTSFTANRKTRKHHTPSYLSLQYITSTPYRNARNSRYIQPRFQDHIWKTTQVLDDCTHLTREPRREPPLHLCLYFCEHRLPNQKSRFKSANITHLSTLLNRSESTENDTIRHESTKESSKNERILKHDRHERG